MRRPVMRFAFLALAALLVPLAGCGKGSQVTVSGAFGQAPAVKIPRDTPPTAFQAREIVSGSGAPVHAGDLLVANYVGYVWSANSTSRLADSSFARRLPAAFPLGRLIPGLDKGLTGRKIGSRVLLVVPPKDGYGAQGQAQLGVKADDTLVFVLDLLGAHAAKAVATGTPVTPSGSGLPTVSATGADPQLHIPAGSPPARLVAAPVSQGGGPVVKAGQLLVVQYVGETWAGRKVFDSSWQRGQPAAFAIGSGQVIKGWDQGLVGQRVGSRLLLVVPPSDGYGNQGVPQAGIKADDTLVFVVDLLGAY